jgi:hypothetical protein
MSANNSSESVESGLIASMGTSASSSIRRRVRRLARKIVMRMAAASKLRVALLILVALVAMEHPILPLPLFTPFVLSPTQIVWNCKFIPVVTDSLELSGRIWKEISLGYGWLSRHLAGVLNIRSSPSKDLLQKLRLLPILQEIFPTTIGYLMSGAMPAGMLHENGLMFGLVALHCPPPTILGTVVMWLQVLGTIVVAWLSNVIVMCLIVRFSYTQFTIAALSKLLTFLITLLESLVMQLCIFLTNQ